MIVDFVHDVVCPWCRIGLANLRAAAAQRPDDPITIRFRPFQLNPQMPESGVDFRAYMGRLKGDDNLEPMFAQVVKAGEATGLTFHFDRIQTSPNSLKAHMLITAAPEAKREALVEALHKAYFEDGRDIGDLETLLAIAADTGLDTRAMNAALNFPDWKKIVAEQAQQIAQDGVSSVPFFVFNDVIAVAGAHSPANLAQAMAKAAEVAAEQAKGVADAPVGPDAAQTADEAGQPDACAVETPEPVGSSVE